MRCPRMYFARQSKVYKYMYFIIWHFASHGSYGSQVYISLQLPVRGQVYLTLQTRVGLGYIFRKWSPRRGGRGGTCGVPACTLQDKAKFTKKYIYSIKIIFEFIIFILFQSISPKLFESPYIYIRNYSGRSPL